MAVSIRFLWLSVVCIAVTLTCLSHGVRSASSQEYYQLYSKLGNAIITTQNNSDSFSNLQVLGDAFFPKGRLEPLCIPIKYSFWCNGIQEQEVESNVTNCTNTNHTYLWTEYAVTVGIGMLLLSYSQNAFALKGFGWERLCLVEKGSEIVLQMPKLDSSKSVLDDCLRDLTSQLKAYAASQATPTIGSNYRGYSISWNNSESDISLHNTIFTVQIVFLSIFIFFFALSTSKFLYENLFNRIYSSEHHHIINPGYAVYWAIVVLSFAWNVLPSWLVISKCQSVIYSLAILIPLLLLVSITVNKETNFPIPCFKAVGCSHHTQDKRRFIVIKCVYCSLRLAIQVFSTWNLLVSFTFFMHYFTTIVLSFYVNPLGTLIKILFIKTVVISLVYIVSLLLTIDQFVCTKSAVKKNLTSLIATITILSAVPLMGYLIYIVGETIFIDYPHNGSWQSILTIIPPALLLVLSWYSHGLLFPKIKKQTEPKELNDVESSGSSQDLEKRPLTDSMSSGSHNTYDK